MTTNIFNSISAAGAKSRLLDEKLGDFINVKDFGAIGDGSTDDTAAIQAAINFANSTLPASSNSNHRVVYLPDAAYKCSNLTLKLGVTLQGGGPDSCQFVVTDTVNPVIKMENYSHVSGLTFYYPNQTTTGVPSAYPATITSASTSPGSYGSICQVRAYGAYDFIILTGCTKFLIRDVDGFPLHLGVQADTFVDGLTIENCRFNASFVTYASTTLAWVFNNATAYGIRRVDQPMLSSVFAFGYAKGIELDAGTPSGSANMVLVNNFGFDVCKVPINVIHHQDGVFFSNGCATSSSNYSGATGLPCSISGGVAGNQYVCFTNVSFRHYYESAILAGTHVQFVNCEFDDWNIHDLDYSNPAAVYIKANSVRLQFSNCYMNGNSRVHCRGIHEDGTYSGAAVSVASLAAANFAEPSVYLPSGRLTVSSSELAAIRWGGVLTGSAKFNQLYAPAVPAAGSWLAGDRFANQAPAAGQPKGWICTAAGTPGTWLSEGNL